MQSNEGILDRNLRIVIGLLALSLMFWGPKTQWGLLGLIPIITGFVGYCPFYGIFNVNTCNRKKRT